MKMLLRFGLLVPCLFVATLSGHGRARAQGYVVFNNHPFGSFTFISTNGIHGGPALGLTAPYPGSGEPQFVYALFAAPSTVTSVSGVMDPNWTFTGAYATNTALPGRLIGGEVRLPSPYTAGTSWNFLVRGWSSTIAGQDWASVQAFVHNLQVDPNAFGSPGQFFGTSGITTINPGTGTPAPTPDIFGAPPFIGGFVLDQVPIPEPSALSLLGLGCAALLAVRRRWRAHLRC